MKKLFILFLCIFTTESFASGIASNSASAPCTNNTLETYSGNSNLSADWQPNEIQLRWYNNNTLMDVQSSANTCVYDGTLTIPQTAPTRTGYTFAGWQVRPEMDFSTIDTTTEGIIGYGKGPNLCEKYDPRWLSGSCEKDQEFWELNLYEWKTYFSHGVLYGMGKCSGKTGNNHNQFWGAPESDWKETDVNVLNNASGEKRWCWCKATGYKPANQTEVKSPTKQLMWIFTHEYHSYEIELCDAECPTVCAARARNFQGHRTALFTPASN